MKISRKRWEETQVREQEYYEQGHNKQWNTPVSLQYWKDFLHIQKLEGNGIEIGCGPNGIYRFTDQIIGLDPIDYSRGDKTFTIGMGEEIPFPDNHFDFAICCNALDHTQDPEKVMEEMFRVAPKVIIWSNVFSPFVIPFLRLVDDHAHLFTHRNLFGLCSFYRNNSIHVTLLKTNDLYSIHGKNLKLFYPKSKLYIASLLGTEGVCIHLVNRK